MEELADDGGGDRFDGFDALVLKELKEPPQLLPIPPKRLLAEIACLAVQEVLSHGFPTNSPRIRTLLSQFQVGVQTRGEPSRT